MDKEAWVALIIVLCAFGLLYYAGYYAGRRAIETKPSQSCYVPMENPARDPNQIIVHDGRTNIYLYGETKIYVARKLE